MTTDETKNKDEGTQDGEGAAPGPEMVGITIDGKPYQAPKGANLLHFMLKQGIDISYFCYHPGLAVVAVCRQCLVELKNMSKLVPACQTLIADGMEVINDSAKVKDARRMLLEFTLVNHPIDCPICDKAGECILQKQYMEWDHEPSKIDHAKVRKSKHVDIGPRIVLDAERCILCSRCVRFCAEVAGDPQLVIAQRGNHSELTVAPGKRLDNPYSLNTVDICPVGALTDKDFRFKIRVWELSKVDSVCNGCATGCKCEVHFHRERVHRLVPRRFRDINLNWMCDYGRYTYKAIGADRLELPAVGGEPTGWDAALDLVGDKLGTLAGKGSVGVAIGADITNEDAFVAARLALDLLESDRVYLAAEPVGTAGDEILRDNDPNPNRAGAEACGRGKLAPAEQLAEDLTRGKLDALYVVGDRLDLPEEALAKAAGLELLAVQASHPSPLVEKATVALPACMWAEVDGTITSREGKVQRLRRAVAPAGFARPHWQILVQAARRAGLKMDDHASPHAIFDVMKQQVEQLGDAEWGKAKPPELLRYAGSRG